MRLGGNRCVRGSSEAVQAREWDLSSESNERITPRNAARLVMWQLDMSRLMLKQPGGAQEGL